MLAKSVSGFLPSSGAGLEFIPRTAAGPGSGFWSSVDRHSGSKIVPPST